jgi:5'-nucleotidase
MNRKEFIKHTAAGTFLLGASAFPFEAFAKGDVRKITILHTNDQHSRIDPFPMDGGKYQGAGGFARRSEVIQDIRKREKHVLLLDSGDIFQGTPYFNKFHGELEIKLMGEMKYDASTLGNHDFDGGLENLATQIDKSKFPFLVSNYDFTHTAVHNKILDYKIFKFEEMKVGVFGLGIEATGLIPDSLFGETLYKNPITEANRVASLLKNDLHCDLVICLSHLGYRYDGNKVSDKILAKETQDIDLILGGHTHTFFNSPEEYKNAAGKNVLVNQVGWAGILLGQIDFYFENKKKKEITKNLPLKILPKTI